MPPLRHARACPGHPVRLCVRVVGGVQVSAMVCRDHVAEGNCVAERRGGEQPEANCQSVGERIRFGVNPWRACWMVAKPGTTQGAETTDKATLGRIAWLGAEWREGKADKRRDPKLGVGLGESEPS